MKNKLLRLCVGIGILGIMGFLAICAYIGTSVNALCVESQKIYGGQHVESLIRFVDDASNTLKERNRAIWALGQLQDPKALGTLKRYYTGEPCDHLKILCQYELVKAIKLCEGRMNITAIFWRKFI